VRVWGPRPVSTAAGCVAVRPRAAISAGRRSALPTSVTIDG